MTWRPANLLIAGAAAALTLWPGALADAILGSPGDPGRAEVVSRVDSEEAQPESHCLSGERGAYCSEQTGVTSESRALRVSAEELVDIRLSARARRVRAWVAEFDENRFDEEDISQVQHARHIARHRRWRIPVPPEVDTAEKPVLRFDVAYRDFRGERVEFGVLLAPE